MDSSTPPDKFRHSTSSTRPFPPGTLPPSTNSEYTDVSDSLQHLSLNVGLANASAHERRSSSRSPSRAFGHYGLSTSPNSNPALHRTPSIASLDGRSSTPTLHKRASMNSLHSASGHTPARTPARRLSSTQSIHSASSTPTPRSPLNDVAEAPRQTPATIARDHFRKDLHQHNMDEEGRPADTIVILQDSCYGHRYSRPKTSRASLNTIVERPERLIASVVGVSVAYVRLGERYTGGQYPINPRRDPSAIPNIPFRIRKTARSMPLSSPAVTNVHGVKWMEELKIMCDNAEAKLATNGKELTRPTMNRGPDAQEPAKFHEGDLYLCSESLDAMEGALGAVCEGVDSVFNGAASGKGPHRAFIAIRPPGHHCSASFPSGFCWLNNVHVGIAHATLTHGLTHAAIIDFDLHHGDGSQAIAWEHNRRALGLPKNAAPWKKTSIGYFSLHDINSYPCEMGDEEKVKNASLCIENAHGQNIWNVHLQPWKNETEFWSLYETKYAVLLEKTRNYLRSQTERLKNVQNGPRPKAAIFVSAGFDASEHESSGMQRHKVNVPTEFYARLTRDIVKLAAEEGTSVEGRVISVLEGGYSDRALCSGVLSHISGLVARDEILVKVEEEQQYGGLGYEMGQKIGSLNGTESLAAGYGSSLHPYDPSWWSLPRLEQLDSIINPTPGIPEHKKVVVKESGRPATFFSPTASSIAKVHTPRLRRSASNLASHIHSPKSRPPSPPPPEIDWTVAVNELSKLLIPNDRQTLSCTPEDLSAEATKARRDRQGILNPGSVTQVAEVPRADGLRKSQRERRPVRSGYEAIEETSKLDRRKTVIGTPLVSVNKTTMHSSRQPGRRLSLASVAGSVTSEMHSSRGNGHTTAMPSRSGTSLSIRPGSSMSTRGPVGTAAKKARVPRQPTTQVTKTSTVRRKSPLSETKILPAEREGASSVQPPSNGNADIDNLTSGMRKIKISLTTKSQREAQAAAQQAAAAAAAAEAEAEAVKNRESAETPVTLVSEPRNATPIITSRPPTSHQMDRPTTASSAGGNEHGLPPHPSTPQPSDSGHLHPWQVALPTSSPVSTVSSAGASAPSAPPSSHSEYGPENVFIPYQPKGPVQHQMVQQEPLKWLPPNTATPSPMKRADLPVFTASSAIPFGSNPNDRRPGSA
ncbi:hypothetical protein F5884DRAFT_389348 [Xylogone sp. PMI_703]|nr:hypothetical protein F5884DRAFT_389348 [Xylogone sp. PMI_703]